MTKIFNHSSTYAAMTAWGISGFVGQPTFGSFVVHFGILPFALAITIWAAHREAPHEPL